VSVAKGRVLVIGSLNMDMVVRVERLPLPGETVLGRSYNRHPGGKGANQAVAASRLDADVRFVGRVGDDADGRDLTQALRQSGVDTSAVSVGSSPTGVAFVQVDDDGQNSIVVAPGANSELSVQDVAELDIEADVVVLQLEVPVATVLAAASKARSGGADVVLNLAPARRLTAEELRDVTHLITNEHEAGILLSTDARAVLDAPMEAANRLTRLVPNVVVTLGAMGAAWATTTGTHGHQPAFPTTVVDTTAAGDAFVGGMAARLAAGERDLAQAVRFACAAGSLATARPGAQPSLPGLSQVLDLLG